MIWSGDAIGSAMASLARTESEQILHKERPAPLVYLSPTNRLDEDDQGRFGERRTEEKRTYL